VTDRPSPRTGDGSAQEHPFRVPTKALWLVPLLFVVVYVFLVTQFFHSQAHWTGERLVGIAALLLLTTAIFSVLWFGAAYTASLLFGEYVAFGALRLISKIPGLHRHVVVTPPVRYDTPQEVWGRFGTLLLITLGFELIFMILFVKGDLAPRLAIDAPFRFFTFELVAGLAVALAIAPAAPFLVSRVRTRITDSLEFPFLWLALLLLVLGGTSILEVEILPGFVFDTGLFLTSILLYAPAAWYVTLAFSSAEVESRQRFLQRAWRARDRQLHFGHIRVIDEPEGTATDV
jgi:hypothetical protein